MTTPDESNQVTFNAQGMDSRLSALEARMGKIEVLLTTRKQWLTYAGWAVAAAGAALSHGGDATAMLRAFVDAFTAVAAGSP